MGKVPQAETDQVAMVALVQFIRILAAMEEAVAQAAKVVQEQLVAQVVPADQEAQAEHHSKQTPLQALSLF